MSIALGGEVIYVQNTVPSHIFADMMDEMDIACLANIRRRRLGGIVFLGTGYCAGTGLLKFGSIRQSTLDILQISIEFCLRIRIQVRPELADQCFVRLDCVCMVCVETPRSGAGLRSAGLIEESPACICLTPR